jgi:hypothetical protein
MFQVQVTASGGGDTYDYGQKVETLAEAKVVADTLQWIFDQREKLYQGEAPWPEWFPAIDYYEGCDVYAVDDQGNMWSYNEDYVWEEFWINGKPAV